jgi:hypothetical protein
MRSTRHVSVMAPVWSHRTTVSKMQDVNDDSPDAIIRQARVALGSRLREIRESRGMTQTAVGPGMPG